MGGAFNGTWSIDLTGSVVWDDLSKRHVPDEVGHEVIRIRDEDGVQDYEVEYGDHPRITMGYTARYDDTAWVPYVVREINVGDEPLEAALASFQLRIRAAHGERHRHFEVGQPYGLVRVVHVDARTHYRISKNPADGSAQSILLRRLEPDAQAYTATVLDVHGTVFRIRRFTRVDDRA